MRKFVTLFMMLMLSGVLAFAQNRVVTGRVIDDRGTPVPYATISEVGKNNAVTADENGNYTITVGQNSRLTISSAGFTDQTVAAQSVVNVTLAQGDSQLQEVVVTAQGIGRRPKDTWLFCW
ncbi:MAG: carboxypeptidase-like regulatory domain-containing protein [Chitinophagaceae bacterium]